MRRTAVVASLLVGLLVSGDPAHAKCISIMVRVQGDVLGQTQEGDELLSRFLYSPKRVETSSPLLVKDKTFTLVGAYPIYKRRGVFHADVCGAAPRQILLVMRDRNGAVRSGYCGVDDTRRANRRHGRTELREEAAHRDTPSTRISFLVLQNRRCIHLNRRAGLDPGATIPAWNRPLRACSCVWSRQVMRWLSSSPLY